MGKHRKVRRCFWCGIQLRWWQLSGCRPCTEALRMDLPSAPYFANSRRNDDPKAPPRPPSHGMPTRDAFPQEDSDGLPSPQNVQGLPVEE